MMLQWMHDTDNVPANDKLVRDAYHADRGNSGGWGVVAKGGEGPDTAGFRKAANPSGPHLEIMPKKNLHLPRA